jgi:hypothetical protein
MHLWACLFAPCMVLRKIMLLSSTYFACLVNFYLFLYFLLRDVVKVLKPCKRTQVTLGMAEHCLPLFAPNKCCWERGVGRGEVRGETLNIPMQDGRCGEQETLKLIITMMVSESTTHMHILPT